MIINNSSVNSLRLKDNMILYLLFYPMKLHNNGLFGSEFLYKSWSLKRKEAYITYTVYMEDLDGRYMLTQCLPSQFRARIAVAEFKPSKRIAKTFENSRNLFILKYE